MRIAVRLSFAVIVGLLCAGITEVLAQTTLTEVAATQMASSVAPSVTPEIASVATAKAEKVASEMAVGTAMANAPTEATPGIAVPQAQPVAVAEARKSPISKAKVDTALPSSSGSVASMDGVKAVINKLSSAEKEPATLEDLNSAREAIAKLDVLIDIEKRLADLSKLRQERGEGDLRPSPTVAPMPASALMPMNVLPTPIESPAPVIVERKPISVSQPSAASIRVERIYGVGGDYSALVKVDGKSSTVRVGEKISDGSVVRSITKAGVRVVKNKKERTIKVNDVMVSDSSLD